jgi:DNA-binding IclR family transcriptional regulator
MSGHTGQESLAHLRRGIQSADKAVDVLLALVEAGQAAPLKELSRIADMPTSLAHRYLASLIARGLATQDTRTGLYDLGPLAIRIGAAALSRVDALTLAGDEIGHGVAGTGLTALLSVMGERGPTIIRWERSRVPFMTTLAVGAVLPLAGSATGRVMLAFLPERLSRQLLAANGIDMTDELRARLETVRFRGNDSADSTVVPGLSAVSSPILDAQGEAVAAITLVGSNTDVGGRSENTVRMLVDACMEVSRACGSPWRLDGR